MNGLDHIYLTVSSFERSESFYDTVMSQLDFRKGDRGIRLEIVGRVARRALIAERWSELSSFLNPISTLP